MRLLGYTPCPCLLYGLILQCLTSRIQLALDVQLPEEVGGVAGQAIYIGVFCLGARLLTTAQQLTLMRTEAGGVASPAIVKVACTHACTQNQSA